MQESAAFERIYFPVLMFPVYARLCMICFGLSGAVGSVGLIIGVLVIADIIIGYYFLVDQFGVTNERNKNYNPLTIAE